MSTSRRGFLKGAAALAGAMSIGRLPGVRVLGRAEAAGAGEPPALFIFNMVGGYNALFPSANSFIGSAFGVTSTNIKQIATSDVFVDRSTLGTLSATTLAHMASIGIKHGYSDHPGAQAALVFDGTRSRLIDMSVALGGTAAVRCGSIGDQMPTGTHRAIGNVSL